MNTNLNSPTLEQGRNMVHDKTACGHRLRDVRQCDPNLDGVLIVQMWPLLGLYSRMGWVLSEGGCKVQGVCHYKQRPPEKVIRRIYDVSWAS